MSTLTLQDANFEVVPSGTRSELDSLKRDLAKALATVGEMDRKYRSTDLVRENEQLRAENAKLAKALADADADFQARTEDYHRSLAALAKQRDEGRAKVEHYARALESLERECAEAVDAVDEAVRSEREVCAKVAEGFFKCSSHALADCPGAESSRVRDIAAAIRARSEIPTKGAGHESLSAAAQSRTPSPAPTLPDCESRAEEGAAMPAPGVTPPVAAVEPAQGVAGSAAVATRSVSCPQCGYEVPAPMDRFDRLVEDERRASIPPRVTPEDFAKLEEVRRRIAESVREGDALAAALGYAHPNLMDAPGGPICACGKPSTTESGWCGDSACTDIGLAREMKGGGRHG